MANIPSAWLDHDKKVQPYVWSHRILSISKSLIALAFVSLLFVSGLAHDMELTIQSYWIDPFMVWLVYFALLGILWELISLPLDIGHYLIEKKYGLSKQNFRSWGWDRIKSYFIGGVIGFFALGALYFATRFDSLLWWFYAAILLIFFSIILAQLTPIVFIPLFYKLEPMGDGELKTRLLRLCESFRIDVKDVYHLGLGEKTEKGNAAFVGLGRTKRILIGDTLYKTYPPEQIEAVFGHELGHQVHHDLWKGIFISALFLILSFYLGDQICRAFLWPALGTDLYHPVGLLSFFVAFSFIQIPIGWLQVIYSRRREYLADQFASQTLKLTAPLADALERLTFQNWSPFRPHFLIEFFTYSHPAPAKRILDLRGSPTTLD